MEKSNYQKRNNYNNKPKQKPLSEMTEEERFEYMITQWKKDSKDRLSSLKGTQDRWIPNERYAIAGRD